jgi:hypothetical protein
MVVAAAIGDQVADRADLEIVELGEGDEVVEPRHRPVVLHDLADHARGIEPREPRDVDRRLGMAGADQHAAVARDQREDVAGGDDRAPVLRRVDRDRDGARAIRRRDAGGDAFARLDRDGERGLVPRAVVARHQVEPELVDALLGHREADQPAAELRHEVDRVGRRHLRGDDEVAFILAILVVDEDEHAAVARLVDQFLGAGEEAVLQAGEFRLCHGAPPCAGDNGQARRSRD